MNDVIMTFGHNLRFPRARSEIDTKVNCKFCNIEIELDSKVCKDYYESGTLGIVCPSCGNFTRGKK